MTAIAFAETVRDLDWYVANFGRDQELRATEGRLLKVSEDAALLAFRTGNPENEARNRYAVAAVHNASRDLLAISKVTEMFEGHPLAVVGAYASSKMSIVHSPIAHRVAIAYLSEEGGHTWSVKFEDHTPDSISIVVHPDRTALGGTAHNLSRAHAILNAKQWVAQGLDPR